MLFVSCCKSKKFFKRIFTFILLFLSTVGCMMSQGSNCEFVKDAHAKNILKGVILHDEDSMKSVVIRESRNEAGTWEVSEVIYPNGHIPPLNKHVRYLTSNQFNAIIDYSCARLKGKRMIKHSGVLGDSNISNLFIAYDIENNNLYLSYQIDFSGGEDTIAFKQICDLIYSIHE